MTRQRVTPEPLAIAGASFLGFKSLPASLTSLSLTLTLTDGGDSRAVQEQLSGDVCHIAANFDSFAAVKVDGTIVTWGGVDYPQHNFHPHYNLHDV